MNHKRPLRGYTTVGKHELRCKLCRAIIRRRGVGAHERGEHHRLVVELADAERRDAEASHDAFFGASPRAA